MPRGEEPSETAATDVSSAAPPATSLPRPLSWSEARNRLRTVLEAYLDEQPANRKEEDDDGGPTVGVRTNKDSIVSIAVSWCILHDLDLFVGALGVSLALLVLSILSMISREMGQSPSMSFGLNAAAAPAIYRGQVAAASILVLGSLISLWMVRRRRFLSLNDSDSTKRREIALFLRHMRRNDQQEAAAVMQAAEERRLSDRHQNDGADDDDDNSMSTPMTSAGSFHLDKALQLAGTSLTDIYPVYRRTGSTETSIGSWGHIPSLLLVQGDYIALQIGDIAPANCTALEAFDSQGSPIQIAAGHVLTLESLGQEAENLVQQLPTGRSTLPVDSDHLLTFCNGMRIFVVGDAPISELIRRKPGRSRSSHMTRQMSEIRIALAMVALLMLPLTALLVFVRPGAVSGDLSLIVPLPLLAALGVFPVIGPAFIFYLEILGTARILTTVHPYASSNVEGRRKKVQFFPETRLLFRYVLATLLTRLSLWHVARFVKDYIGKLCGTSGWGITDLVRIPPFSLNLLETLGVATAFALIDDELACEPSAIPQQLLIPSSRGMKLLDLCPTYDEDYSDDESCSDTFTGSGRKPRGRSFDSDSSEEATPNFNSSLRRKVLPARYLKRRRTQNENDSGDGSDDTEDSSFEVQFEEPLWWQHLPTLKCIGLACLVVDEKRKNTFECRDNSVRRSDSGVSELADAKSSLVKLVCSERKSNHLRSLAQCIGFSTKENSYGPRGDLSPFSERLRLHVLSNALFRNRLEIDAHERSSEQSKWWGTIRPDSTSVVVHDARSKSFQLLTIGDPEVVINLCNEAWQGEISTILPLGPIDRQTILETTNNWKLGDLDVAAFSYAPVPHTLESRLAGKDGMASQVSYLSFSMLIFLKSCFSDAQIISHFAVTDILSLPP